MSLLSLWSLLSLLNLMCLLNLWSLLSVLSLLRMLILQNYPYLLCLLYSIGLLSLLKVPQLFTESTHFNLEQKWFDKLCFSERSPSHKYYWAHNLGCVKKHGSLILNIIPVNFIGFWYMEQGWFFENIIFILFGGKKWTPKMGSTFWRANNNLIMWVL